MMPDDRLVEQVKNGAVQAFEQLVDRYQKQVYNIAYRYTGNREDAYDLTQETFIKAYKGIGNFRQEASFKTWIYLIAANVCRDHLRKNSRIQEISLDEPISGQEGDMEKQIPDSSRGPDEVVEAKELSGFIQSLINELQGEYREVIILREIQQLSYEEIAEVVQCSLGTVKSRLNRARKLLKERMILAGEQFPSGIRQKR